MIEQVPEAVVHVEVVERLRRVLVDVRPLFLGRQLIKKHRVRNLQLLHLAYFLRRHLLRPIVLHDQSLELALRLPIVRLLPTLKQLLELVRELIIARILRDSLEVCYLFLECGRWVDVVGRELSDVRLEAARLVPEALVRPLVVARAVVALVLDLDGAQGTVPIIFIILTICAPRALHKISLNALAIEFLRNLSGLGHLWVRIFGSAPRAIAPETMTALSNVQ